MEMKTDRTIDRFERLDVFQFLPRDRRFSCWLSQLHIQALSARQATWLFLRPNEDTIEKSDGETVNYMTQ